MNVDDRIDEWARDRAEAGAPDDFVDRVMEAVAETARPSAGRIFLRVAAVLFAAAAGAIRIAAAFAIFSASCSVRP